MKILPKVKKIILIFRILSSSDVLQNSFLTACYWQANWHPSDIFLAELATLWTSTDQFDIWSACEYPLEYLPQEIEC
jgi:hypothetical protein